MAGLARWTAFVGTMLLSSSKGSEDASLSSAEESTEQHGHEEDVSFVLLFFQSVQYRKSTVTVVDMTSVTYLPPPATPPAQRLQQQHGLHV